MKLMNKIFVAPLLFKAFPLVNNASYIMHRGTFLKPLRRIPGRSDNFLRDGAQYRVGHRGKGLLWAIGALGCPRGVTNVSSFSVAPVGSFGILVSPQRGDTKILSNIGL